jgi:hypothetical protein
MHIPVSMNTSETRQNVKCHFTYVRGLDKHYCEAEEVTNENFNDLSNLTCLSTMEATWAGFCAVLIGLQQSVISLVV